VAEVAVISTITLLDLEEQAVAEMAVPFKEQQVDQELMA
jgi:hypothetical protein